MMIDDDILNRYLDNDLNDDETREVEKLLAGSPELRRKMNLLRLVDSSLKNLPDESPSSDLTSSVMNKILAQRSSGRSQNIFYAFVSGFFIILCLGLTAYFGAAIVVSAGESTTEMPEIAGYLNDFINSFMNILGRINLSVLGGLISLILIITGYFFFENVRNLKKLSR